MLTHSIPPEYDINSRILILGSFPSVKSRESHFFYGHPKNRFWKTLAAVFHDATPETVEEKKAFLHLHHIALWDVIARCDITGSADNTIKNETPNDLSRIISDCSIRKIFVNGKTAEKYYNRYMFPSIQINAVCLPSTSPANAAKSLEELTDRWSVVRSYCEDDISDESDVLFI